MTDDIGFDWDALTGPKKEGAGVDYVEVLEPVPADVIAKYNSIPGLATAVMAKSNGTMSVRTIDGVVYRVRTSASVAAAWQNSRGSERATRQNKNRILDEAAHAAIENDLTKSPWEDEG